MAGYGILETDYEFVSLINNSGHRRVGALNIYNRCNVPKALPIRAYLEFSSPDLLHRPYAMAANAVILMISCVMALLYFLFTRRLVKKLGGER